MVLERDFKKAFQSKLKKMGCTVLQYKQDSTTIKGFPDTIVLGPEAVVIFIEWKRSKRAKFQPLQKEWGERLLARNFFYYCIYPENADECWNEIKEILK